MSCIRYFWLSFGKKFVGCSAEFGCVSTRKHVDTPRVSHISRISPTCLPYLPCLPYLSCLSISLMSLMSLCVLSHGPCLPYICDFSFTFLSHRVNCEPTNSIPQCPIPPSMRDMGDMRDMRDMVRAYDYSQLRRYWA